MIFEYFDLCCTVTEGDLAHQSYENCLRATGEQIKSLQQICTRLFKTVIILQILGKHCASHAYILHAILADQSEFKVLELNKPGCNSPN